MSVPCDIIIPVHDRLELTKACVESIELTTRSPYRLILIDNGSLEETARYLEAYASCTANVALVRNEENLGWVKAANQGLARATGPFAVLMNNDTVVKTPDWLGRLIEVAESEPDIGLVNPRFDVKMPVPSKRPYLEVDFCRGYCLLITRR